MPRNPLTKPPAASFRTRLGALGLAAITVLPWPSGRAQARNPILAALPDGQWSALPDSAMTSAGPMAIECCDFGIGCELPGIFSFSGATLDTDRRRIVVWGGGHNDYFGNQLVAFEIATLQWQLLTSPTSVCLFSDPPDYRFTNGLPVSRHTYDHIDYVEHLGVFLAYSGATADAPPFNNGTSYGDLWTFDFGTGTWSDLTPLQSGDIDFWLAQPGASGEYDPLTRRWLQVSQQGIWSLDLSTHVWTKILESGHPGIERVSVLDPDRRLIWSYGGDFGGSAILAADDIDANQIQTVSTNGLPGNASGAGLAYDGANDQLVIFGGFESGAQSVFNYDIDAGTWAEYPYSTGPASDERTYGRFLNDELENVFFLIESVDRVWVWKNTLGSQLTLFYDGFESGNTDAWATVEP
ncbi:MAG: hypothetical protein MI919_36490 [Holophagales bacterium]|nr:hypothetical protein [Holophagales bacterium]